jgi:hypothetical protein
LTSAFCLVAAGVIVVTFTSGNVEAGWSLIGLGILDFATAATRLINER